MARWIRIEHAGATKFGTLADEVISICAGDIFDDAQPTGEKLALSEVEVLVPVTPSKMVALANNSSSLLAKMGGAVPREPHYFLKANSSFHPDGKPIKRPHAYVGKVIFEGELGLVIGKTCRGVTVAQAPEHLFGCTCINDVTAIETLNKDANFAQWTLDGFAAR